MRALGSLGLVLLALFSPLAAAGPVADAVIAAAAVGATDGETPELRAPTESKAELPARGPRLEPPERLLLGVAPYPVASEALKPHDTSMAIRGPTLRPWAPEAPLHIELCCFLC
ncbi:MAG: hypothetical protein AAGF23_19090 [Acidobacteriota bacterium]